MLTTFIQGNLSKFIILEDDLEVPGDKLFKHLITAELKSNIKIIYLQFNYNLYKNISRDDVQILHRHINFITLKDIDVSNILDLFITNSADEYIVIVDSLTDVICKLGERDTYKLFQLLLKTAQIKKIMTQLHVDLLKNDEVVKHLINIASLYIKMEKQFAFKPRLSYIFKKGRGKVIKEVEEFTFTPTGELKTMPVSQLTVKTLLQSTNNTEPSINSLTTFNIELNEHDKMNRNQLNLPFLPRELQSTNAVQKEQGEIFYEFDEGDDWDAEDPDDDLDI